MLIEALQKKRLFNMFFMVIGFVVLSTEALEVGWNNVTTFMSWYPWGISYKTPKDPNPWALKSIDKMVW